LLEAKSTQGHSADVRLSIVSENVRYGAALDKSGVSRHSILKVGMERDGGEKKKKGKFVVTFPFGFTPELILVAFTGRIMLMAMLIMITVIIKLVVKKGDKLELSP
jgi:hypothetical protein